MNNIVPLIVPTEITNEIESYLSFGDILKINFVETEPSFYEEDYEKLVDEWIPFVKSQCLTATKKGKCCVILKIYDFKEIKNGSLHQLQCEFFVCFARILCNEFSKLDKNISMTCGKRDYEPVVQIDWSRTLRKTS